MTENGYPETAQEAIIYFSDAQVCHDFMVKMRWPNGVVCPRCGSVDVRFSQTKAAKPRRLWNCHGCKKQFTLKVGTIFEDSPLGLEKWLPAVWLIVNAKNGISSCELARSLGVTQKTAWFMLHRIRVALQEGTFEKMSGQVEADETYIGGKAKNMHTDKRIEKVKGRGRGATGKAVVMGLLERNEKGKSRVRTKHLKDVRRHTLHSEIANTVEAGSEVITDALPSYERLDSIYTHNAIDHARCYAIGHVHTNGLENFWSLLKRSIRGTYVSVNHEHLFRYLDEQAYRFNYRQGNDCDRFLKAVKSVTGARLTYRDVTRM